MLANKDTPLLSVSIDIFSTQAVKYYTVGGQMPTDGGGEGTTASWYR